MITIIITIVIIILGARNQDKIRHTLNFLQRRRWDAKDEPLTYVDVIFGPTVMSWAPQYQHQVDSLLEDN